MKFRPIIFSGESVRAILEGRKTQTRRVIKHGKYFLNQCKSYQHHPGGGWWGTDGVLDAPGCDVGFSCPYGVPGDRLWVRETWWKGISAAAARCIYADDARLLDWRAENYKKHSPLFMPRAFSRLTLEIVSIRVERVQEITHSDAVAEGLTCYHENYQCAIDDYKDLWDSINAKRGYSWNSNPWVWVIEFKKVEDNL